jgi:hypothetical protein
MIAANHPEESPMNRIARRALSTVLGLGLLAAAVPAPAFASADPARLEGLVIGIDGRPAAGHAVVLVDDTGRVVERSTSNDDGLYRFEPVAPGDYGIGLELPDGTAVPVPAADGRLRAGELARRDIRLLRTEQPMQLAPGKTHSGLVLWWVGLSPAAKTALIVGAAAGVWLLLDSGSDDSGSGEGSASPFTIE